MIHVDRTRVTPPAELVGGEDCPGAKERKRASDFYATATNRDKPYDKFKAYKLPGVVKALNELFQGKCAYCESNIGATQPTDVEHFRPKGGYVVRDSATDQYVFKRPGYYWLAAAWENLLPSCIDCNRERTQEFQDQTVGKVGKASKFPIANEVRRATKVDEESRERRLLLHPCEDEPEQHLEFTDEGIIRPALIKGKRKTCSRMGKASIEVYGLLRNGLVQRRADRAVEVLGKIQLIKRLEQVLDQAPGNLMVQDILREEIGRLKWYMEPQREYVAMTRQLVKREYGSLPG